MENRHKINFNSYIGMAENDYLFAYSGMQACENIGIYNSVASTAAQSAEKYLKHILNHFFAEDSSCIPLLKSHNLRTILNKILTKYPNFPVNKLEVKWLGDFYYDARYPGDDFLEVSQEEAAHALEILDTIKNAVEELERIRSTVDITNEF